MELSTRQLGIIMHSIWLLFLDCFEVMEHLFIFVSVSYILFIICLIIAMFQ